MLYVSLKLKKEIFLLYFLSQNEALLIPIWQSTHIVGVWRGSK